MAKGSGNYGWSSLGGGFNSGTPNGTSKEAISPIPSGRVISIVLDSSHPRFKELGEWSALGAIEFDSAANPSYNLSEYPVAYPLFPNIKNFPLIHETVILFKAITSGIDLFVENQTIPAGRVKNYYINPISIWNHPHHNGYSFLINDASPTQNKSYNQIESGSPNKLPDTSSKLYLGKTFTELPNIHPLLPFEGDIIYEGRWGNSIRLGSTVKNSPNPWSNSGNNGNPITIIRNGQGNQTDEGWVPITENINRDDSSIYLTSTQQIPLDVPSNSYVSYPKNKVPISINKYESSQIVLSSGRLVFASYEDHILLTSIKSINLNSKESVNIDSPELSIQADKVYIGKYQAGEPLMLGVQTANLLKDLVQSLTTFMTIASTATTNICVPGSPTTLPTINSAAQNVLDDLFNLSRALGSDPNLKDCNLTSKRNYTV